MGREELVYIVDDDSDVSFLLKRQLTKMGFTRIELFESGTDFYEKLDIKKSCPVPDLLLMDTQMPGNPGFQICRLLKHEEPYKLIKIIGMSSLPTYEQVWLEAGADGFIDKEKTEKELPKLIERILLRD